MKLISSMHYSDVTMSTMLSQITGNLSDGSTVYLG